MTSSIHIPFRYGIPVSTVIFYVQNDRDPMEKYQRIKPYLSTKQETDIMKYALWMAEHHLPLTTSDLVVVANKICKKVPTRRWAQRLIKKHQLSLIKPNIIHQGRSIAASLQNFKQHFDLLQSLYSKFNFEPGNIINMNETGWSKQQIRPFVIGRRGGQRPNQKKCHTYDHITSVHCISADGQNLPTMIIFKKNIPNFTSGEYPDNCHITSSDSGFMNSDLFLQWLKDIVIPYRKNKPGPFLLTMDNASPHISYAAVVICIMHNIEIFSFLPNASGWLQPLDQIFGTLKHHAYDISRNLSLAVSGFITNKKKFPYILHLAIKSAFSPSLIISSFRRCGIYPFNPLAVDTSNIRKTSSQNHSSPTHKHHQTENPCIECGRTEPCATCMTSANPLAREGLLEDPVTKAMLLPPPIPRSGKRQHHTPKARHLTGKICNAR